MICEKKVGIWCSEKSILGPYKMLNNLASTGTDKKMKSGKNIPFIPQQSHWANSVENKFISRQIYNIIKKGRFELANFSPQYSIKLIFLPSET